MLIALSLALAPGAWAAASLSVPQASLLAAHADMDFDVGMDMSDCMKAMGGIHAQFSGKIACKCCNAKHKCPDSANCMYKSGKVMGSPSPAVKLGAPTRIAYRQAVSAKPPNWLSSPPFTPPRS